MNKEAVLGRILEEKDNLDVRLIYADLLEEQGDASSVRRAAYIRESVARCRVIGDQEVPIFPEASWLESDMQEAGLQLRVLGYEEENPQSDDQEWPQVRCRWWAGFPEQLEVDGELWATIARRVLTIWPIRSIVLRTQLNLEWCLKGGQITWWLRNFVNGPTTTTVKHSPLRSLDRLAVYEVLLNKAWPDISFIKWNDIT